MPIQGKVIFSKPITTPSGKKTLGLFGHPPKSKKIKLIDVRICQQLPSGKFKCPRASTQPKKRARLAKKLGY